MNPPVQRANRDSGTYVREVDDVAEQIPVLAFANAVLRKRRRIAAFVIAAGVLAATWKLTRPARFVSSASFSLQGSDQRRLSGLAAQFGFALPGNDGQQTSAYYVELLTSREILSRAASAPYVDSVNGRAVPVSLAKVFRIEVQDSALAMDRVVDRLAGAIGTSRSRETGIVHVSVEAPSPVLAQSILRTLLSLLSDFNVRTRQSQAANERRFVEARLAETRAEVRSAEDRLQEFLQRNRSGMGTPVLSFEHDRLEREVVLRQQLLNSLSQSYEQARLDEVRDTPAITTIESPSRPARREPRGMVKTTLAAMMVSGVLAMIVVALLVLVGTTNRSADVELAEFRETLDSMRFWRRRSANAVRAHNQ